MRSTLAFWPIASVVALSLVSTASPAEKPVPAAAPATAAPKQQQGSLAAMQVSIEKQRASIARGMLAADPTIGKAGVPFFNLPPPEPLGAAAAMAYPAPQSQGPFVMCDPLPEAYITPVVAEAATRESLEPRVIRAVIQQESGFRPCVVSKKGAQGLMQLMPATAEKFGVNDPFDVRQNIDGGSKFLKELLTKYGGNLAQALGAYNAGPAGDPQNAETAAYVAEILKSLQ